MDNDSFIFEKPDVYNLALEFTKKVYATTLDVRGKFYWTDQFNRAATSIVLHIAEGSERKNPKEERNFYNIAKGSMVTEVQRNELRNNCISIAKMLTRLIQSVERNAGPQLRTTANKEQNQF